MRSNSHPRDAGEKHAVENAVENAVKSAVGSAVESAVEKAVSAWRKPPWAFHGECVRIG